MASFGSFETVREIYSGPAYTVFSAKKSGDPKTEYAIKLFNVRRQELDSESEAALDSLIRDVERACVGRIAMQQRAAASSKCISPILETGHDERGVWYATYFYPRSVNRIISGRVALSRAALHHIVGSVAQGALDFKRVCGRSHGDIQASNIQVSGDKLISAAVVLSDPMPGDTAEATRYELSDLRGIGRILLQLVLQREISQEQGVLLVLPVLSSSEWTRLFEKDADRWLALCNRLLDPELTLERFTLDQLVQELEGLRAKPPISRGVLIGTAAVILVLGLVGVVAVMFFNRGSLLVTTEPPGAEIKLEGPGGTRSLGKTPLDKTPLSIKSLPKGDYKLRAEFPGLTEQVQEVTVEGGKTRPYNLAFPFGLVSISSAPASAAVEWDGKAVGLTPYASPPIAPGTQTFLLRLTNHQPVRVTLQVSSNRQVVSIQTNLTAMKPGESSVEFRSVPGRATVSEGSQPLGEASFFANLTAGPHTLTARFQDWPAQTTNITVLDGENPPVEFHFPHGVLRFDVTPGDSDIFIDDKPMGQNVSLRLLQPKEYTVRITHAGYKSATNHITIKDGDQVPLSVKLEAMFGFVELTSDPPGAEIRDETDKLLAITLRGSSTNVPLPPGPHTLKATFPGLAALTKTGVAVDLGARKPLDTFKFDYGTVIFSDVQPAEVRADAGITAGNRAYKVGEPIIQKPAESVSYVIQVQGYERFPTNIAVAAQDKKQVSVTLARLKVPVKLTSDPAEGVRFYAANGMELEGGGRENRLAWGALELTARHPRLGAVTLSTNLTFDGTYQFSFPFTYGELILTNLPRDITNLFELGADGKEQAFELSASKTEYEKKSFEKPGTHKYGLRARFKPQTNAIAIAPGPNLWVITNTGPPEWINGLGMTLVQVNDGGSGRWVGKSEVTQEEYQKVMGSNPSAHASPNFPVEGVPWIQAKEFCRKLTDLDKSPPSAGGHYSLPSLEEWKLISVAATNLDLGVFKRDKPADVGSKGPDALGLNDVIGNVNEWLDTKIEKGSSTNAQFVGGHYGLRFGFETVRNRLQQGEVTATFPGVGLRVIWVSAR